MVLRSSIACDIENMKKLSIVKMEIHPILLSLLCGRAADNGLNPTWPRKPFTFTICNSAFAFLRFVVNEMDMFNDLNFLAQATFPIKSLKTGKLSSRPPQCIII